LQLNADWEGAVARLVRSPLNNSGLWEKGYFKAKLGRQTVHVGNGKPFMLPGVFDGNVMHS
jgi:hypothetical protein